MEKSQNRESVTIWCMLSASGDEGTQAQFETMNAEQYCDILSKRVIPFFKLSEHQRKLFQQDRAPPRYSLAARNLLNSHLPNRWTPRTHRVVL